MGQKDYYTVLGVPEDASQEVIKKTYRKLAKKFHPDRNAGDAKAEQRFKEVQEAYDVLGEPEKRQQYDQLRRMGPGGHHGINLEDLFGGGGGRPGGGFGGSIFDLFERAGHGGRAGAARRGEDLNYDIRVPFDTAAFGGTTAVRVSRSETCSACEGNGAAPGTRPSACPDCGGRGSTADTQGGFAFSRPCPRCFGRGTIIEKPCTSCGGSGERHLSRKLTVKIPAGVADGGKIRLKGEGEAGTGGAPSGDLLMTVRIADHEHFTRDGLDVEGVLKLDIATASLGTETDVETVNGKVKLRVPAGVQPGTRLRLTGAGVTNHRGKTGDHYVKVVVEIPRRLTEHQRKLLEEFRDGEVPTEGDE
jgi:molecular chaperone DnaJ